MAFQWRNMSGSGAPLPELPLPCLTLYVPWKYAQDSDIQVPRMSSLSLQEVRLLLPRSWSWFCCHRGFSVCCFASGVSSPSWIHHGAAHFSERKSVCLYYCHNQKAGPQWNIRSVPAYLLSEGPFNLNGVLSVMPLVNEWVCEGLRAVQCGKNAIISF